MESKKDNWVKKFSCKRNAWYMFNTKTAESQWCSKQSAKEDSDAILEEALNIKLATKKTHERTPANDRLKRLQDNLKKKQKLEDPGISKKKKPEEAPEAKQTSLLNSKKASNAVSLSITSHMSSNASGSSLLLQKDSNDGTEKSSNASDSNKALANNRSKQQQHNLKRKKNLVDPRSSKKKKSEEAPEAKKSASLNSKKASNAVSLSLTSQTSSNAADSPLLSTKESNDGTKERKLTTSTIKTNAKAGRVTKATPTKPAGNENAVKAESGQKETAKKPAAVPKAAVVKVQNIKKPSTGIISKLKESASKQISKLQEKLANDRKSWVNNTNFKIPKQSAPQSTVSTTKDLRKRSGPTKSAALTASSSLAVQQTVEKLKEHQQRKAENQLPSFAESHPSKNEDNFQISVQHKGGANKRLEKLRRTLEKQQETDPSSSVDVQNCSVATNEASLAVHSAPFESSHTSTATDEVEPMDWESIEEDCSAPEIPNVSISSQQSNEFLNSCETMADYYDTLRDNLLRITASKPMTQNWLQDHLYCVIDTNVLLDHLTFIEDLKQIKMHASNGCILFIPYVVLQELDKLKLRGPSEGAKTRATRAIKYLNRQLEAKVDNVRAQSALDDKRRLIDVTSPDDSIVNCCLQVKRHVDSVVLLSEDVNLRTKAIANDIKVATKADLV